MTQQPKKVVKKGTFKRVAYSSAKRYSCEKGELTLTTKNLIISCDGKWSKPFRIMGITLRASDKNLEVRNGYDKIRFRLIVENPNEWVEAHNKIVSEHVSGLLMRSYEIEERRPAEMKRLLDMNLKTLKRLYAAVQEERSQFRRKNIRFNLDILDLGYDSKNRKLKAYIVAHSYVAWYEWTKRLLSKIYKAKFGKGPKDDGELMKFLDDYPSSKGLFDTSNWGINVNQIRNCVSHEKFYFDYRNSELVFMAKKEKRIRLLELRDIISGLSRFYIGLLNSLRKKVLEENANEN